VTETTLQHLIKCNAGAFDCIANLEAYGYLNEGAMLGLKDQLSEQLILLKGQKHLDEPLIISSQPVRSDLTDTECVMLLSWAVGGLMKMAPAEDIRRAVLWLALDDEYWERVKTASQKIEEIKLRQESEGRTA
jgi:hypothetical protein